MMRHITLWSKITMVRQYHYDIPILPPWSLWYHCPSSPITMTSLSFLPDHYGIPVLPRVSLPSSIMVSFSSPICSFSFPRWSIYWSSPRKVLLIFEFLFNLFFSVLGKVALTILVDMMELHRNNLVVIIAGYSKEMDALLKINPGFM